MTLLQDDGSSPLDQGHHIRPPLPPEILYGKVVFESGMVVDARHKDGLWTGVIVKQIEGGDDDDDKHRFLVSFDSPPDILPFDKKQLRPHFDWTGSEWVRPDLKELDKGMFRAGTMVEVSSVTDRVEVAWFPAMMVKEIQEDGKKKFVVKDCNKRYSCDADEEGLISVVDASRVRPIPPPFSCKEYGLMEPVEAFLLEGEL